MIWPDPTHQPTQPPTQPPNHTHPWVENSSQISNLQTELKYLDKLKCYRILSDSGGPPPWGVADGWMGAGVGMSVCGGVPCMYACTHMHARMHMHVKHAKHAKHGCLHAGSHLQFYTCVRVHVCACACMWGHPPMPPDTPRHPPPTCTLPRAAGSPKHQISITLELIEIIRFCLKILYLWTFLNSYRL